MSEKELKKLAAKILEEAFLGSNFSAHVVQAATMVFLAPKQRK